MRVSYCSGSFKNELWKLSDRYKNIQSSYKKHFLNKDQYRYELESLLGDIKRQAGYFTNDFIISDFSEVFFKQMTELHNLHDNAKNDLYKLLGIYTEDIGDK